MKTAHRLILGLLLAAIALTLPVTARAEGSEQYNLAPGGTYYFDLSGVTIPGTVNPNLPDTSLHWVPFTYVGTINAYSLDEDSSDDTDASDNAVASNRSLFVAEHNVTTQVSWETLDEQDLIFGGEDYQSGDVSYKLRSLSAGNRRADRSRAGAPESNEWDRILEKNAGYIKNWFSGSFGYSWGQDTVPIWNPTVVRNRALRGFYSSDYWYPSEKYLVTFENNQYFGFRPALEILSPTTTELKTVTFDMGAYGFIGDKPSLTSVSVVYTGTITLPDIITDSTFSYWGRIGWGKLRWSDGTNFYEMGKGYGNIPSGTTLTPAYMTVEEQFNLDPGGIYYFDLSGQNIPGVVNPPTLETYDDTSAYAPDKSLKWVPFLYVGTINAYSLDENSIGDPSASGSAEVNDRSLFVSACDVSSDVSWTTLHGEGLIFGRDYQSGGVNYVLRSMSMGSRGNYPPGHKQVAPTERGLPIHNEWDQTLDKDAFYRFRGWNGPDWLGPYGDWGQDTCFTYHGEPLLRAIRNKDLNMKFRRFYAVLPSDQGDYSSFRPVLQITSDTSTELKTLTFDLGANGTLGTGMHGNDPTLTSATVVYTGLLTLPEITDANGFNYTGAGSGTLGWYDGTTFYEPGDTVDLSTGTTLTARYSVQSSENDITGFTVAGQVGDSVIDAVYHTVEFHMPHGTDVTALTPTVTVSADASISPDSGVPRDFTNPVSYTVTAQDGTQEEWVVTCVVDPVGTGSISGTVYDDGGGSGGPIGGATVTVTVGGTPYTATTAGDGTYTITNVPAGTGYTVTASKTGYETETVDNVTVAAGGTATVDFILTPASGDSTVSIAAIPGVTAPVRGATPVTAITETAEYSGTVTWNPNHDTFAGGTVYTATITLTPKAGYTLTGVGANSFTVAGAVSVSNAADSGVVIAVFPATQYIVTFDKNGGTTDPIPAAIHVNPGASTGSLPTAPSRAGYTFNGWNTERDGSGAAFTASTVVSGDLTVYAKWTYIGDDGDGGDDGDDFTPSVRTTPGYTAGIKAADGTQTLKPVTVDRGAGTASIDVDSQHLAQGGNVTVTMPSVPGVTDYTIGLTAANLTTSEGGTLTFTTDAGSLTLPSDMLLGTTGAEGKKAQITMGRGDKAGLPEDIQAAIGERPLISLALTLDGRQTDWNNPDAPVTVSIPYTPTPEELLNPESIVVWYIDGSGRVVSVPNGRYDPATGTVTFTTTHFSYYAVSFKQVSFVDVAEEAWYAKAVSFIAAREITTGTGDGNFSPEARLTRGQFIVMLMRAYGIAPDASPEENFADAGETYYTGYLAAAKRLGISAGVGNNLFAPEKEITRQEMFTLLYNALKVIGQLPEGSSGKTLTDFSDAGDIALWARDAMTLLVETGTVGGSDGKLFPTATTTRAEMAQVLYNLLGK